MLSEIIQSQKDKYKILFRVVKFIGMESRMMAPRAWGEG